MSQDDSNAQMGTSPGTVLEIATRVCLGIVGVLYAIGFTVQTLHLARYGITDTSMLKAEYVLTGLLVCVPIMIPSCVIMAAYISYHLYFMKKPELELLRTFWLPSRLLLGSFAFGFSCLLLGIGIPLGKRIGTLNTIRLCMDVFSIYVTAGGLLIAIVCWSGSVTHRERVYRAPKTLVICAISLCGLLFASASLDYLKRFIDTVHPTAPAGIGGARPIEIQFFFDPESRPGFLVEESTGISKSMLLYGQSESCYLISGLNLGHEETGFMQIRKDQVLGMRVKPTEY